MPANANAPRPALSTAFDARTWSNTAVIDFAGSSITLPTYGTGEGFHENALVLLNGNGSRTSRSFGALLTAAWTGAGGIVAGIDEDDFFYLESDTTDFTISAAAGNTVFGFSAAGHALVGGAAPFRRTATSPWTRGVLTNPGITIDPAGAGASFAVSTQTVQSLITWLRVHAQSDADGLNGTGNIEALAHAAPISVTSFRALVTDTGYVQFAWSGGALPTPTWPSASFAARLGFTGSETVDTSGATDHLTASKPLPGFWVPPYAPRRMTHWVDEETHAEHLTGGVVASNHVARWSGWRVELNAFGEVSTTDDEWHLRQFWQYAPVGYPLTFWGQWGDPRRQLYPHLVTSSQPEYDLLYTSEKRRGRLRCYRDPDDNTRRAFEYEGDLYCRARVDVLLRDRQD